MSVRDPIVVSASWQLPAPLASEPVQLWTPSPTVTLPVGVGPDDATWKLTVNGVPTPEGSGVSPVIVVLVPIASSWISLEVTWAYPGAVKIRVRLPGAPA